ncbi:MAG: hypothetical protein QM750_17320 [Rubrivivax sp.]
MERISLKTLKPRNPLVAAGRMRHAGAHRRGAGGERQDARRGLQRELADLHRQRHSP